MMYRFCFLLYLFLTNCSSMKIEVASSPSQADIFLVTNKKKEKVGMTPSELNSANLASQGNYHLVIEKPGFEPHSFIFESRRVPSRAQIFAELKPSQMTGAGPDPAINLQGEVDIVARKVAVIQTALSRKELKQAEILAKELLSERPRLGVGWSLLANTYYLQRRNSEALTSYEKALEMDPGNKETEIMIRKITGRGVANE